jgi:Na+/H+-dicarboxylate symporter
MLSLFAGVGVGYACNVLAPTPVAAKNIASYFSVATDIFLRMIKMIIAPLVFATSSLVSPASALRVALWAERRLTISPLNRNCDDPRGR